MTQPKTPFKLHASSLSPDAPVNPADLPSEVAGQPASYFWKDMIHTGNYVHPSRDFSLAVDKDRLSRWAATGQRMMAAGVAIPINCDHSDKARDVVGYVKEFKLDDDRLLGLCQFIGDDAALTAARNLVSVGIDPDFTDGQGQHWGEAIVHVALTPVPVVPDQDDFIQATDDDGSQQTPPDDDDDSSQAEDSSDDESPLSLPCTDEQFRALQVALGDDLEADDCVERIIGRLQDLAADDSPGDDESDLQTELAAAREQVLKLSSRLPPVMSQEAESAMVEAATMKFDAAVSRGSLSPAARDRLVAALVKNREGRANVMALSRSANPGGDCLLAMAVADALLESRSIELGERSGLQAMARSVPGEQTSPIAQLQEYMTRIASVSG
jgi:hypothetical protein